VILTKNKQLIQAAASSPPPPTLEDRLEQRLPTVLGGRTPLIRKICSRTPFEIYLSKQNIEPSSL